MDLAQLIGNAETDPGPRQHRYFNSVVFIVARQQGSFPAVALLQKKEKDFPAFSTKRSKK